MSLKSWFEQKSREKSESNIRAITSEIIQLSMKVEVDLTASRAISPFDSEKIQNLQQRLMIELCGPIPLEEVKTHIIDPILTMENVSDTAKNAIVWCYDYVMTH